MGIPLCMLSLIRNPVGLKPNVFCKWVSFEGLSTSRLCRPVKTDHQGNLERDRLIVRNEALRPEVEQRVLMGQTTSVFTRNISPQYNKKQCKPPQHQDSISINLDIYFGLHADI